MRWLIAPIVAITLILAAFSYLGYQQAASRSYEREKTSSNKNRSIAVNTRNTMTKLESDTSDTADLRMRANIPKDIAGKRVVVFNVWKRAYKDAQGYEKEGITAVFSLLDDPGEYIIGPGSRITVQNEAFDVLDVQPRRDDDEAFVVIHPAP